MSTLVLNAYATAYPTITSNRIRASIYLQSDPQAFITSQTKDAPHPQRTWSFPGLPRNNYGFIMEEIDVAGNAVTSLAKFDVVPGELESNILFRLDEQIKVGTTVGLVAGLNTFTFDGTAGKPDYRGWDIVPSELTNRGILVRGKDYSWNKDTGLFTLLTAGDVFEQDSWYNIRFGQISNPAGDSYPVVTDFTINLITANTTLDATYFAKKLIVEPAGNYVQVILPSILTVPQGRRLMVEVSGTHLACVKFDATGSDNINYLNGEIYAMPGESFSIYRYIRGSVSEWRLCDVDANFRFVGQIVSDDLVPGNVYNKQKLDGTIGSVLTHARLYNEVVLRLPLGQTVDYDVWSVSIDNKMKYSKANSTNPANTGKFFFPDRRSFWERATGAANKAGDYIPAQVGPHDHGLPPVHNENGTGLHIASGANTAAEGPCSDRTQFNTGVENTVASYLINKYVLL